MKLMPGSAVLAAALLASGSALAQLAPPQSAGAELQSRLDEIARTFQGTLGVAARNLETGETFEINPDVRFPTASTIKTAVMVEVFHQLSEGRFRRDTLLRLAEDAKVGGTGALKRLHGGIELSVADLLSLMIGVSDNTATNMLIGLVGTSRVNDRMEKYGLTDTKVFRPTFRDGRPDVLPELEREFGFGMSTPREMARLMELIATGQAVDRAASDEMVAILRTQEDEAMIPRRLPFETHRIRVANKTGSDAEKHPDDRGVHRHIRADAAIVEADGLRYVVAIFARQVQDTRWTVENDALTTGAEISRLVYEHFRGEARAR